MTVQRKIAQLLPNRSDNVHKGQCGRVGIFAGSLTMPGAAMLATRSAFRSGAGLVYLAAPPSVLSLSIAHTPETIGIPLSSNAQENADTVFFASQQHNWDTLIIGPGLGKADTATTAIYSALVHKLHKNGVYSVIDADALPLATQPFENKNMAILTPHEAEFSRLFGPIQNRQTAACQASQSIQQTIVLKGQHTVIANTRGHSINPTGNPGMATAGTGDVLSGILGAIWAQYPKEERQDRAWEAAALAVWLHGKAGDIAFQKKAIGLIASDITDCLGDAFFQIGDAYVDYTRSKMKPGFQIAAGAYSSYVTKAIWKGIRSRFHFGMGISS